METCQINRKIAECVSTALKKLGGNIDETIFYYLNKDFGLERLEIAEKPEVFERAILSIFGEQGSKVIMKLVLEELRKTFALKKVINLTFREAVDLAKNMKISEQINRGI
jgi:hypothetical protein